MAKIYNIVRVLGNDQFTYQLYNNLSPSVEGTSSVISNLTASSSEEFIGSFTVSGVQVNGEELGIYFLYSEPVPPMGIDDYLLCGLGTPTLNVEDYPAGGHGQYFFANGSAMNGNYAVYRQAGRYKVYFNETLIVTTTPTSRTALPMDYDVYLADTFGTITNVVLGT